MTWLKKFAIASNCQRRGASSPGKRISKFLGRLKKDRNYIFYLESKFNETFSVDAHLVAAPHVQIGLWQIFRFFQKG